MPRYEYKGSFYFATPTAQTTFASAVQSYMDAHPTQFRIYPGETGPTNFSTTDHSGGTYQLVRGHMITRTDLDTLFSQMKSQAQTRGAIAPSKMWLKQVADTGGVTDSVFAAAPDWADITPSPE
jgi:hypothetical protein